MNLKLYIASATIYYNRSKPDIIRHVFSDHTVVSLRPLWPVHKVRYVAIIGKSFSSFLQITNSPKSNPWKVYAIGRQWLVFEAIRC